MKTEIELRMNVREDGDVSRESIDTGKGRDRWIRNRVHVYGKSVTEDADHFRQEGHVVHLRTTVADLRSAVQ